MLVAFGVAEVHLKGNQQARGSERPQPVSPAARSSAVLGCHVRDPQSKGGHRCKVLCSGHPLVFLSRPVCYVGVSRGS